MSTLAEQVIDHGVAHQAQAQGCRDLVLISLAVARLKERAVEGWKAYLFAHHAALGTRSWWLDDPDAYTRPPGLLVDTDELYARHHLTLIEVAERYANDAESRAVYDAVVTAPAEGGM